MRLFAGVFPPSEKLEEILRVQKCISELTQGRASWTAASRMHLTLRFFGDSQIDDANRALQGAVDGIKEFDLSLERASGFPNARLAKVGFLAPVECFELTELAARLNDVDDKKPRPHLTIARFRWPVALPMISFEPIRFCVSEVVLVQSILGHRPQYRIVQRYALAKT